MFSISPPSHNERRAEGGGGVESYHRVAGMCLSYTDCATPLLSSGTAKGVLLVRVTLPSIDSRCAIDASDRDRRSFSTCDSLERQQPPRFRANGAPQSASPDVLACVSNDIVGRVSHPQLRLILPSAAPLSPSTCSFFSLGNSVHCWQECSHRMSVAPFDPSGERPLQILQRNFRGHGEHTSWICPRHVVMAK